VNYTFPQHLHLPHEPQLIIYPGSNREANTDRQRSPLVYSSYRYRPDYVQAAVESAATLPRLLDTVHPAAEAASGRCNIAIETDPPTMRQAIAWNFFLQRLRQQEDVKARRVRTLYLPAYIINYRWGETFNAHGERIADEYQAIIGGATGEVAAELHYSSHHASLLTAGATLAVGGVASFLSEDNPWSFLMSVENSFLTLLLAFSAGEEEV
jgi:hypothetical protein